MKQKLPDASMGDALCEVLPCGGQNPRFAAGDVCRPVGPSPTIEPTFERHEQPVVVEPPAVFIDELGEPFLKHR